MFSGNCVVPVTLYFRFLHFLFFILTEIIIKDKNYIWFEILCENERENCPKKTHVFSGLTLPPVFGLFISGSLFKQILDFPPAVVLNYLYDVAITLNSFHQHYNFQISNDWERDDAFFRNDHKICNGCYEKKFAT